MLWSFVCSEMWIRDSSCDVVFFFFQAEDGIRGAQESRGLGDVYKRQPLCRPTISIKMDTEIIPQTVTEHRAQELIEHLKTDIAPRNSEVFLTSREIMIFLKDGINVEYRIKKNVKNIRQVKKDVIEKAFEMFPTSVSLSKKSNGHKEVRVVLRQSSYCLLYTSPSPRDS